jgi:hypothetical protein
MPEVAVRYVLGRLSEVERHSFERLYLVDQRTFEGLEEAEDDLIGAYVRDELSPEDRRSFESHFLATPEHRLRVRFARALAERETPVGPRRVAARPGPRRGRLVLMMALVLALAGAAFYSLWS